MNLKLWKCRTEMVKPLSIIINEYDTESCAVRERNNMETIFIYDTNTIKCDTQKHT